MASQIDVRPAALDLLLYAGDGVEFRLICTDSTGAPVTIDGEVSAQVRLNRDVDTSPIAEFTCDILDAQAGIVLLALTGDQTQDLIDDPSVQKGVFNGVWDVQWTPAGNQPRTLCQGKVECVADVTR